MVEGFGFRKHERVRQRDRRERQKHERRERERHEQREIAEEHALEEEVQRRLVDGDLREKVAARVAEALATDEVQARVSARCDAARRRLHLLNWCLAHIRNLGVTKFHNKR